jgi:ribosomal protein L35AE/L33A
LRDLAEEMILTKKNVGDFNFGTGTANTTSQTVVIKAIAIDSSKETSSSTITKQVMFKTSEVGELSAYDAISIKGVVWRIGNPIKTNGFITVVEVFKG